MALARFVLYGNDKLMVQRAPPVYTIFTLPTVNPHYGTVQPPVVEVVSP